MTRITVKELEQHFDFHVDAIADLNERRVVALPENKAVILISEEEYARMMKIITPVVQPTESLS